jgi:predicted site-specific integrase-resolvase
MLTSSKLGKAIGLSKATVIRLAKEGRIPSIILPSGHRRFDVEAVKVALSTDLANLLLVPPTESQK